MEPNKGEEHPVYEEESVLEQVVRERNMKINTFENMIVNESDFNLALVTMPDDFILELYDYLAKLSKRSAFMLGEEDRTNEEYNKQFERLDRINAMLLRLEDLEVVQNHMVRKDLTPEDVAQINETVAILKEKQDYRKKGPVGKAIHRLVKRYKEQKKQK